MGDTTKVKSLALIISSALLLNINYLGRHGCEKLNLKFLSKARLTCLEMKIRNDEITLNLTIWKTFLRWFDRFLSYSLKFIDRYFLLQETLD